MQTTNSFPTCSFFLRLTWGLLLLLSTSGVFHTAPSIVHGQPSRSVRFTESLKFREVEPGIEYGQTTSGHASKDELTVDGRQPGVSAGMSLDMLAELLLELGAVEGLNLDGGGSTTMVIHNKVVNRPSDQSGQRPVSDAILIFPKAN